MNINEFRKEILLIIMWAIDWNINETRFSLDNLFAVMSMSDVCTCPVIQGNKIVEFRFLYKDWFYVSYLDKGEICNLNKMIETKSRKVAGFRIKDYCKETVRETLEYIMEGGVVDENCL